MSLSSRFRKGPPPALQILFRGTVVAELSKERKDGRNVYIFRYFRQFRDLGLAPLPGVPYTEATQTSPELWPFFLERIPDSRRPEIAAWMRKLRIGESDDIRMLAELGAHSATDPFEIRLAA
jgi:hypothetical protein